MADIVVHCATRFIVVPSVCIVLLILLIQRSLIYKIIDMSTAVSMKYQNGVTTEEDDEGNNVTKQQQQHKQSTTTITIVDTTSAAKEHSSSVSDDDIVREGVIKEIHRKVLRQKLAKMRHLVLDKAINPEYLDKIFPQMIPDFHPQTVHYNGGIANIKEWKISCYLEVMEGGIPCTNPNLKLLHLFQPLLDTCNDLFLEWYRQQHACNNKLLKGKIQRSCKRIMTFLTRYTPNPGEQALLKVNLYRLCAINDWLRVVWCRHLRLAKKFLFYASR